MRNAVASSLIRSALRQASTWTCNSTFGNDRITPIAGAMSPSDVVNVALLGVGCPGPRAR